MRTCVRAHDVRSGDRGWRRGAAVGWGVGRLAVAPAPAQASFKHACSNATLGQGSLASAQRVAQQAPAAHAMTAQCPGPQRTSSLLSICMSEACPREAPLGWCIMRMEWGIA